MKRSGYIRCGEAFYTKHLFRQSSSYIQTILHITQRSFHTQTLLHGETFTRKNFALRNFCTEQRFYKETSTQSSFYTEQFLRTNGLQRTPLHRTVFTHRLFTHSNFYTDQFLHNNFLHIAVFTRRRSYTEQS